MKKVLINVEERELRVAILEDEQLVELYIESLDEKSILNNIYKGRVEDVLPGLKAAFVNVGLDRNAFLHFDDVRPDLLWAKYRDMHPELADEVPTAREALAESTDSEQADNGDSDDQRKRRRGRRGGKKRRPDSEDTYSPGLPVGVTEDDLEDDDEDDTEVAATPVADHRSAAPQAVSVAHSHQSHSDESPDKQEAEGVSTATPAGESADAEARRLARQERQRQRRERWQQRKLERQQRRHQERADRAAQSEAGPGNEAVSSDATTSAPDNVRAPEPPPPVYGTRGAASAYDSYAPQQLSASQRRQNKARYGDNFGNVAPPSVRRNDHRDNQVDFFGPASATTEDQSSIWDDRQPDLGPVPGLGKAFLDIGTARRNRRGNGSGSGNSNQRHSNNNNRNQQNQNQNRKPSGGKRRGGKKRIMRKRDNRSYFAFSADEIDKEIPVTSSIPEAVEEKPKKVTRKRKTAAETEGESTPKKATTRKTAAKKPAVKTTKAAAAKAESTELPLDIATTSDASAPEKPKRTRKTTASRTRKTVAKAEPDQADLISAETETKKSVTAPQSTEQPEAPAQSTPVVAVEKDAPATETVSAVQASTTDNTRVTVAPQVVESVSAPDSAPAANDNGVATPSENSPKAESAAPRAAQGDDRNNRRRRNSRAERAARHRQRKAEGAAQRNDRQPTAETPQQSPVNESEIASAPAANEPVVQAEADQKNIPAPAVAPSQASSRPSAPAQQQTQQQSHRKDREPRHRLRKPQFQEVFRKGDEIMVQVVKEEIGMKGARISSYVSLPGRYLVLLPYPNQEGGISRKVEDIKERKRLKTLLRDISSDETAFIVRTAGVYQEEKEIRNDVEFLSHEWKTIADKFKKSDAKSLVYDDHDILYRLARDVFDDSVSEILIDSHVEAEKLKGILGKLIPGLVDKVKLDTGAENIFQKYGINKQIQKAARRKVWLKSGGYLIIDEAEALTAIDVNTGKSVGKDDQEKLILRTNIEAARAVARELKLRDIGGLIVIDFIDMKDARNKEQVLSELKLQLRKDRSKTSVSSISEFGLVEMTRKRVRRSLRKTIFMDCPYCQGAGAVLNEQQIWLHIKHEVIRQLESTKPAPTLNITVNPKIRAYVDQNYRDVIRRLEQKYDTEIRFTMSDIFHIENYQIEKLATTGVINGSATVPGR